MEKNICYPTHASLLNKAREKLISIAEKTGLKLRQTYHRLGPAIKRKVDSYEHAKQYKCLSKGIKTLKTYLGRVVRDVERSIGIVKRYVSPSTLDRKNNISLLVFQNFFEKKGQQNFFHSFSKNFRTLKLLLIKML